jgi:hypothetical protein
MSAKSFLKSEAKRKRIERKKRRAAGFRLHQFWLHRDDASRVLKYLERMRVSREPLTNCEDESAANAALWQCLSQHR